MNKKSKKLLKNTAILSFGTICTKGIMFIMTPLLTRWLTQSQYGTFDLLSTYITLLIPFVTLDIGEATFRFLANDKNSKNDEQNIVSCSMLVSFLGLIVSFILIVIISFFITSLRGYIGFFALLLLCESINTFISFIIRGLKKLPIYALSNVLFVFVLCISSVIFVYKLKLGLNGILISYSLGYFVSSLFSIISSKLWKYVSKNSINFKLIKEMLKYSLPLMPNAISWWFINVSDRTIVSSVLGTSINAIYAVANKIPNLCQTFFYVFHLSWQENAIETMNDQDKDIYFTSVFNNVSIVISSICIVILASNFLFFNYIFSYDYFKGYYMVPILVISIIFSVLSQFIGSIHNARMESKKNGSTTVIAAITNIIVHLALIRYIGIYAAVVSTLCAYFILFVIRYLDIRKSIKLKFTYKTWSVIIVLLYFFISVYINNNILNYINFFVSIIVFCFINSSYVKKIIKDILKIRRK